MELRSFDPSGNYAFASITIIVQEIESEPDQPPGPTPEIPSFNPLIIIGIIGCISALSAIVIKRKKSAPEKIIPFLLKCLKL